MFLGVPRVWEKIAESMQMVARDVKGIKAKVASWAKGVGLKANYNRQTGYGRESSIHVEYFPEGDL